MHVDDPSREVDERYRRIVESTQEGLWIIDKDARVTFANSNLATMLDTTVEDLIGSSLFDWMDEEARKRVEARLGRRWEGGGERYQNTFRSASGRPVYALVSATLMERGVGGQPEAMALITDISELRAAERALRASEEHFRALVQHASDLVLVVDRHGAISYASPSMERLLGRDPLLSVGSALADLIDPRDTAWLQHSFGQDSLVPPTPDRAQVRLLRADGSIRTFELMCTDLLDDPAIEGIVVNGRDVTEQVRYEDRLLRQALYDSITGLPNRVLLKDRLGQAIQRSRRDHRSMTVMFLDIDHFKVINDSMGHESGDRMLAGIGDRLRGAIRAGDTVARFGGDEFVVVCEGLPQAHAGVLAQVVLATISTPMALRDRNVVVTASMGLVVADLTDESAVITPETILRDADVALYRAKESGRDRVVVFNNEMHKQAEDRLDLEQELRLAVAAGDIRCAYQPIVSLVNGAEAGLEALARWTSPVRGVIPPSSFIPIAEVTGLIVPLGEHILVETCRQVMAWPADRRPTSIAVNVSARQFIDESFPSRVAAILVETKLDPSSLCLEITESALIDDVSGTIRQVARLHELGVKFAIDDFGTGWSSLDRSHRWPPTGSKWTRAS